MHVAVVGSPPYAESLHQQDVDGIERAIATGKHTRASMGNPGPHSQLNQSRHYGITSGQLGALPSGALDARPVLATVAPVTTWQGCYSETWQDLIVPEAFAHPAKFARGLIHRIYRHMIEQGHIAEGMTVLDPFGGVGLGALDALTYGLRYVGVELEPRFVALGQQNLALWRQRYGFSGGTIVQGDSRQLRAVLAGAQVQAVVGSPPYAAALNGTTNQDTGDRAHLQARGRNPDSPGQGYPRHYGTTPGQLGAMPPGAVVGSPPFGSGDSAGPESLHRRTDASAQAMLKDQGWHGGGQTSPENLAAASTDTFWSASAQIMQEVALLLPAGAVCAWVLKSYVSKGKIVPFPQQWRALCEAHGFETHEIIYASLIEEQGVQHNLFGNEERLFTKRASFFRRLAEKKGSPSIDHEDILIMRRASL